MEGVLDCVDRPRTLTPMRRILLRAYHAGRRPNFVPINSRVHQALTIELLFAHLKRSVGLGQLQL